MAKKATKSKDLLAKTAAKKKSTASLKTKGNIAYARSKKKSTKTDITSEIYPVEATKLIASEDTTIQTTHSRFLNSNNGVITALFSNTPIQNSNEKIEETVNQITTVRPSFQVQFNKLEKSENILELTSFDSKIKLQFDDKTPNKKKPAHRPLSVKSTDSVFWKNVDEKTNITFEVKSDRIEQNITVNKKAEKYNYSLILSTENLDSKIVNNGQTLQLSDQNNNIFTISAPTLKNYERKTFTAQTFNVKEIAKNKIEVSFEFNAELVNKEGHFPISITPQILNENTTIFKYQHFSRATTTASWKAGQISSSAKFFEKDKFEKNILTINKDTFSTIQGKKISGVFVKIQSDTIKEFKIENQYISIPSNGFGYLDITKDYFNANGKDIILELFPQHGDHRDPSSWREIRELPRSIEEAKIRHDLEDALHNPPWQLKPSFDDIETIGDVVVEYFIDDELMPASESYGLAGGVEGNVTLDTGEITFSLNDIAAFQTSLPFKISHTYKQSGDNFYCGKNWRLNLNQTLIKGSSQNNGSDFIYTDGNGYQHGFIESYYYFDDDNKKISLNKSDVSIDKVSGTMYYEKTGKKYEVFKDQRTSSGLKLNTKLDGFKDIEYYEQREKEEKQLEDALFSYKKNLSEYVIADTTSGQITNELKNYFNNGILAEDKFNSFIGSISTGLLLPKQQALQLESYYKQIELYNTQKDHNDNQRTLYRNDSINTTLHSIELQKKSIDMQKEQIFVSLRSIKDAVDNKDNKQDRSCYGSLWTQLVLLRHQALQLGLSMNATDVATEFSVFFKKTENKRDCITTENTGRPFFDYNDDYPQYTNLSLLEEQKKNANRQNEDIATQLSLIDNTSIETQIKQIQKQIDYIISHNCSRIDELKKIYKDYINYEYEYIKLQKTIVVASLSDGTKSLCFNKYGELCALIDSYNNCLVIEYDIYNRISNINNEKKSIIFKYNHYGLLSSITDFNGNRVEYIYSSTSNNATLKSIKRPNGDTISFTYGPKNLTKISSELEKNNTKLTYISNKKLFTQLESIVNYSLVNKISDQTIETVSESIALKNNVFSKTTFEYGTHECTITSDNKLKRYFMDEHGCLIGGYAQKDDGSFGAYSYVHVDRENNESISISETDDEIVSVNNKNEITLLNKDIPSHIKEFMFSALISEGFKKTLEGNFFSQQFTKESIGQKFEIQTRTLEDFKPINKITLFGIRAVVTYSDKSTEKFENSAIQRSAGTQLCALPLSLNLSKQVSQIKLSFVKPAKTIASCDMLRLAPSEYKKEKFDTIKNILSSESGNIFICLTDKNNTNLYRKTITNYNYSENHLLLETTTTNIDTQKYTELKTEKTKEEITKIITKYSYNDKGAQLREETYIEGEENTRGIAVDENVFDDNGRIIKNKVYNTLESSNKKYTEKEFNDNSNSVKAEIDALGVNKITYEYDLTTNNIATKTYPSGSKFAYSRDCHTNAITGISQSTEDGESNSIETHYNCGLITKHTSGTNSIEYEYNAKRERSAVYFNGVKKAEYKHEKNIPLKEASTNKTITTEKSTITYIKRNGQNIVTEAYIDSKKNLIQTTLNNQVLFKNTYSKTNDLISSTDFVTGEITTADYDEQNHRIKSITRSAKTTTHHFLESLNESYIYDIYGNVTGHAIIIGNLETIGKNAAHLPTCFQTYTFKYNTDKAKTLKSIKLPNKLILEPQKDLLGRDCGKTLLNENGDKLFGEYVSFRKVGDHTSDMISSISYGEFHNGKYSISEGIRYKYDNSGNIIERWENGKFASSYSYDHLNRLIREDNAFFDKTWLFSYDKNGNRSTKMELDFTRQKTSEIIDFTNANIERYSYDGDMLTSCNNDSFEYDELGNPTIFKNKTLSWNNSSQLTKFGDIDFDYDGYGKRIRKNSTYFIYDTNKNLILMKKDGKNLEFIYDISGLSGITLQDQQFVLRKNAQGDITDIFTINGDLVAHYEYDAWGNHKVLDKEGNEITDLNHIGNMNPFRYRGYFYDVETNLYYLINRYYDPETGRFISQDQISYLQPDVINGLNLFAYCGNNPVMRIDENGCFWEKIKGFFKDVWSGIKTAGLFIAGLVVAAIGFVIASFAFVFSISCVVPLLSVVMGPITGCLFQIGASICTYGGMLTAAACDSDYYNDMEAIGWNPFNSNEQKVLDSKNVSFYKGIPVIRTNADRSCNIGTIFLKREEKIYNQNGDVVGKKKLSDINEIKHEWGHHFQMAILGPVNYLLSIGIPSAAQFGVDEDGSNYHQRPWENIADQIGGAEIDYPYNSNGNAKHLIMCSLLGRLSIIGSALW